MQTAYTTRDHEQDAFDQADQSYFALKAKLRSDDSAEMSESQVERFIEEDGREVLRCLLQGHIDLRNQAELDEPSVTGKDGVERTHRVSSKRTIASIFGEVDSRRAGRGMRGYQTLFVHDAHLNLACGRYSHEVARRLARMAVNMSFEEAQSVLETTAGLSIQKRQAEELVYEAAQDFDAFYQTRTPRVAWEQTGSILVLSFDERGVPMRKDSLRKATKEARKNESKLRHRRTKGIKKNRKRRAMTAAVYTIEPNERTVADIVSKLDGEQTKRPPRPEFKRVWASVKRPYQEVMRDAFEEALLRDPGREKTWVVPIDGDPKLAKRVEKLAQEYEVEVTIVIDVIHVIEYLWKAAYAFFDEGSSEAEKWVSCRLERLLKGRGAGVARGMRQSATKRGLSKKARKPVDTCADYIHKRLDYLDYGHCLAQGLPIASGVIEGACRTLIADRMELTGARWGLDGAEAMLKLRAICKSKDFEEYWRFHEESERMRNHRRLFADDAIPNLVYPREFNHLRTVDRLC